MNKIQTDRIVNALETDTTLREQLVATYRHYERLRNEALRHQVNAHSGPGATTDVDMSAVAQAVRDWAYA